MHGFVESCKPLFEHIVNSKYKFEISLCILSILILVGTITSYLYIPQKKDTPNKQEIAEIQHNDAKQSSYIYVDVSGAVHKPKVYLFQKGSRIYDAIEKAGGLTDEAAHSFIQRNVNFARILNDQEKIYIPTSTDVLNGNVDEYVRIFQDQYLQPSGDVENTKTNLINLNYSVLEELDQLPGIGKTLAERIIENRPYSVTSELMTKNVLKKAAFQKIENLITVTE